MPKITVKDLEKIFGRRKKKALKANGEDKKPPLDDITLKKVRRELKKIPAAKTKKQSSLPVFTFYTLILAGLGGFIFFSLLNYRAVALHLKWAYLTQYLGKSYQQDSSKPLPSATPAPTPTPLPALALPEIAPPAPSAPDNRLKIAKLDLDAPVIWNVPEDQVIDELKNGVVHYDGTTTPGSGGNIFLVGHSSNYFWIKSDYNQIFALLDKLEKGDRVEVRFRNRSYFYNVIETKTVSPKQVEYLKSANHELLTLMTCWPIGTSLERLIVQAELAYSSG